MARCNPHFGTQSPQGAVNLGSVAASGGLGQFWDSAYRCGQIETQKPLLDKGF